MYADMYGHLQGTKECFEMNLISVETQRKLMYIPYVNALNYLIWCINVARARLPFSCWIKGFWSIVGHTIPVWFVFSGASRLFPNLSFLLNFCTLYFSPIAMSIAAIKFQEKYL